MSPTCCKGIDVTEELARDWLLTGSGKGARRACLGVCQPAVTPKLALIVTFAVAQVGDLRGGGGISGVAVVDVDCRQTAGEESCRGWRT